MTDHFQTAKATAWLEAARPATLSAAVVPVLVGTAPAVAAHHFRPLVFVITLAASLLIQIGTNFANDLYDFRRGADTAERLGPVRITASGLVTQRDVFRATCLAFGLAAALGFYLALVGGLPILLIGLGSIAAGVAYTAGPYPLGYHGLGDVFTFVFFGPVAVLGTYYLQTGTFEAAAAVASIPVGLLVTAILIVNNVRDIDTDRLAGKLTLAVRWGRAHARTQYAIFVALAYIVPFILLGMRASSWLFWLPLLTIPRALALVRTVHKRTDGPALNAALRGTGQLHMAFGLLLALSLVV